jgi:trimeric autotransporter adhesin
MKTPIPLFLIIFSLTCFAFLSKSQAVVPPPDGGYPGGNTAEGHLALASLNTSAGLYNTAVGVYSLLSITDGDLCTALGAGTLFANTAPENTAIGAGVLFSNSTGTENAALGTFSLFSNTTGSFNTAAGSQVLFANTTGTENTANGTFALNANTEGSFNTAIGAFALADNTTGSENTAMGVNALRANTTGFQNTAVVTARSLTIPTALSTRLSVQARLL